MARILRMSTNLSLSGRLQKVEPGKRDQRL
jgi:hypothetical protein